MSESSIRRHTLFFIWLALCRGLNMGSAQYGDQIIFMATPCCISLHYGTERLKAQVASRGCIGLLHDGIMTRVPQ